MPRSRNKVSYYCNKERERVFCFPLGFEANGVNRDLNTQLLICEIRGAEEIDHPEIETSEKNRLKTNYKQDYEKMCVLRNWI